MVFRLYLVDRQTGKCTGKKRDYPSEEHFKKYGLETYKRYDSFQYLRSSINETTPKLCYLDENNKWKETTEEMRTNLGI